MKLFLFITLMALLVPMNVQGSSSRRKLVLMQKEREAQARLTEAQQKYGQLMIELREATWHAPESNYRINKIYHQHVTMDKFRNFSINLAEYLKVLPTETFQQPGLKRQIKRLSDLDIIGLDEDYYWQAKYLLDTFNNFSITPSLCAARDDTRCDIALLPDVVDIIFRARYGEELSHYWREWRNKFGAQARRSFEEYLELYKRAAYLNGHLAPSLTWYLNYEDDFFMDELTEVMNDLQPLYKELHAYVRHILHKKFGSKHVSRHGVIPQYLMEQVIQHAWVYQSVIDPPHKHKNLPNIIGKMTEQQYTPLKLVQMASRFFESLGFDPLPSQFWTSFTRMKPQQRAEPDCKAKIYNFSPDVAYEYCPQVDFRKFLQVHGDMARIYYAHTINHLPLGLNQEAMPGFGVAIGEACILSASTTKHLTRIGLLPENEMHDPELDLKRLFRFGIHTLLTIPMYYVHDKFWVDALDHRINPKDFNCGYWRIQQEVAGVGPGSERDESTLDPNYKFFIGLNSQNSHTMKFISEVLGYQFYKHLCLISDEYVRDDPRRTLQNCDFYESRKAGDILKQMMSAGANKSWREIMYILTGETRLSAKGLREFYEPLYHWLRQQNRQNGVHVGWNTETVCRS